MRKRKFLAMALSVVMTASLVAGCGQKDGNEDSTTAGSASGDSPIATENIYGLRDKTADGAILHCFSWSFKTITESMEDIAMAGFSTIQTSPINACYDGGDAGIELFGSGKWYYHYQPTDWTIGNYQLGTKEEFKKMCETAHSYGIKVLVDVAPNHTTKELDAISKTFIDAVGGMDKMYHSNGMDAIIDYKDRSQCTLMAVGGLYDVNTENPLFQNYFINYLNECIACGADGFRYDTAKHIGLSDDPKDDPSLENNFWDRVTTEVKKESGLFSYGETLQDGGERTADYIKKIGATTASSYGANVRSAFITTNLFQSSLKDLSIGSAEPNVVTWVESHDNYTGDDATYSKLKNVDIKLAWSLIAARAKGTPLFFARPYGATEANMWGTFNKIGMAGDNLYKDATVVAANRFRNAMVGLDENIYNPEGTTNVIVVERGTKGVVIINASKGLYNMEMDIALENGEYVNRVDGTTKYTVSGGKIIGSIPGKSAVVLYNEGYVDVAKAATVKVDDTTKGNFNGESTKVTLVAENAVKSTYSINGGEEVAYKNGDVITVGKELQPSETLTLTLRGENEKGNKTCITYIFKKLEAIKEGTKIYFEKPEEWAENVYAYVYDETSYSSVKNNKAWPGVEMTLEADGRYSYTFTEEWLAPLVIFNDRNNQTGSALAPGFEVVADKVYTAN